MNKQYAILSITFFLTALWCLPVSGQDTDLSRIEQRVESLSRSLEEMSRRESSLRDQQTTRIMNLEEEIESSRQRSARQISELERQLSQEQALLREHIQIINSNLSTLEKVINEKSADMSSFQSEMKSHEQKIASTAAANEQIKSSISTVQNKIDGLLSRVEALSGVKSELDRLKDQYPALSAKIAEVETQIAAITDQSEDTSSSLVKEIADLKEQIMDLEKNIQDKVSELSQKIAFTDQGVVEKISMTEDDLALMQSHLAQREIFGAALLAGALLLGLAGLIMGFTASRRATNSRNNMQQENHELRIKMEEQGKVIDSKLIELLDRQVNLLPGPVHDERPDHKVTSPEADHTLAIILADEVYKIMKRHMEDPDQLPIDEELKKPLRKLWKTLKDKGYEVVDLQNKPYSDDLDAEAEFLLTHELLPGEQVISRVIKPLILHHGSTARKAVIQVMVGE